MGFVPASEIRARFCRAMSAMYRAEVPAYGDLVDLVVDVNAATLAADPDLAERLRVLDNLDRISEERHGAIRLGKAEELFTMRRLFAVMGMEPVGYYDLASSGIPVHSTAFRPVDDAALKLFVPRLYLIAAARIDRRCGLARDRKADFGSARYLLAAPQNPARQGRSPGRAG